MWIMLLLCFCNNAWSASEPISYPKTVTLPAGVVTIQHPSVSDWRDFSVLSIWVPVDVKPKGSTETWTGSVLVEADTEVHFDERRVSLSNLRLAPGKAGVELSSAAPSLQQSSEAEKLLQEALKQARQSIALEYLLRALPADFADSLTKPGTGLNHTPPGIIISERPAMLMLLNGPPRTAPIRNSELEIVVNTDWAVFHHLPSQQWYLVFGDYWLQNNNLAGGTWVVAKSLPADFDNLAMAAGWEALAKLLPPKQTDRKPPPFKISYEPAELILFDGPPQMEAMEGTGLQFAANSDHDLFLFEGRYYLLLAGRWFSTKDLKRKWTSVQSLPDAFLQIPADSDKAYVLSAVPGTEEYRIATIEAALAYSQSMTRDDGDGPQRSEERNPGRQAYKHTYGYSGTYTADQGLKKDGPQGSGSYYDPTYDPRQRDPNFWMAFGYGGYGGAWPPYGYGARYYPALGGYRYGGYYDPFWGNPYPYPTYTSVTVDLPDDADRNSGMVGQQQGYSGLGADTTAQGHIYSGPDGRLYRITEEGWQIQQGKKWVTLTGPVPDSVAREYEARLAGYASYQRYVQEQNAAAKP